MNNGLKYGLEQQDIEDIIAVFKQRKEIESAVLFGSRAMDTHRPGSDIDIVLVGKSLTHSNLLDIILALDELNLPYKFDIIIHDKIKEQALLEHITRVGKTLLNRSD